MKVVAYVRRSTGRQSKSRALQLREIRAHCDRVGWDIVAVETDTASGKSRKPRPGLS